MDTHHQNKRHQEMSAKYKNDHYEYKHERMRTNYVDKYGLPYSFKFVWVSCTVIILLVALWMIYKNESTQAFGKAARNYDAVGVRYQVSGYQILVIGLVMAISGFGIYWFMRRAAKKKGK